jgi:O-antigen ligase
MTRETLDRWCERGILALVLGILVYSPLAFGAVRGQEFLVVQLLTLGVLLLWLARVWLNERPKFLFPPLGWGVLAFAGYAVGRYLTCDVEYVGRLELLRILVYTVLFFAVLNNLHRSESTQIIAFTWFGLAVGISFYAGYQFFTGTDLVWNYHSGYLGRGSGTYICPNHLAGFLEMLLPLAVAYLLVGRGKPLTKILIGYSALVMVVGLAVTASRGGWVAAGLAVILLGILLLKQRPFRLAAGLLLGALLVAGIMVGARTDFFQQRFSKAFVSGKVDLNTRQDMWRSAGQMWRDHPWFGVGPGHYDLRFPAYRPARVQLQPDRVHNEYLNLLADWGVVGAVIVGASLLCLGWGVVRIWPHVQRGDRTFGSNQSDKFAFVLGATAGLFAMALHSLVDFNLHLPANAIIAVTLMALLTSHWRFATDRFWISAAWPGKLCVTVLLLAPLTYLGAQEIRLGREWLWKHRADQVPVHSLERAALLEKAWAAEPNNSETAYLIGEIYRHESFAGPTNHQEFATQALTWYQRAAALHPYEYYYYLRQGMVLDFQSRHAEAEAVFMQAEALDPNGFFTAAHIGRHYVEAGAYAAARPWLERSLMLAWKDNPVAETYLRIANERLLAAAQDPLLQQLRLQMQQRDEPAP